MQSMLFSPLEQFNILSVYDMSLAHSSIFDIVYIKGLLAIWYIFYQLPKTIFVEFGGGFLYTILAPLYSVFVNSIGLLVVTIITGLSNLIENAVLFFLHTALYGLFEVYHSILSFFWNEWCTDLNITYSADHVVFLRNKLFLLGSSASAGASAVANGYKSGLLETNFALVSGGFGTTLANIYFLFLDISLSIWSYINDGFLQSLLSSLSSSTNDFSYLILSLNTSTIWLLVGFLITTFLLSSILTSVTLVPKNNWQAVLEMFYEMVLDVVNENAGIQGRKYFPLIFTTFLIILFCNLLGMIPYSFTVTSHIIVTFSMALAIFVGINILGILKNGTHFLSLFFPPGAPLALAPLLVFIEFISYTFRVLSLSIRLFANLMSGHTLLKILSTFGWAAVSFLGIFLIPLLIIFMVTGLELAIGFLQAYIFSVLLCIYINEAFNLH